MWIFIYQIESAWDDMLFTAQRACTAYRQSALVLAAAAAASTVASVYLAF